MKIFRTDKERFIFSVFKLDQLPLAPDEDGKAVLLEASSVARNLCEDAYYLSTNGEGEIAIELLRIASNTVGGPLTHLLSVRSRNASEKGGLIRHEACVHGLTALLCQNGYLMHEISFESYVTDTKAVTKEAVWGIRKTIIRDQGAQACYVSVPFVKNVDWQTVYAALDGSGCGLEIQVIPTAPSESDLKCILENTVRCQQAAEGNAAMLRDPLALRSAEKWSSFYEEKNNPMASVNIIVFGSAERAALVVARIQQAIQDGPFSTVALAHFKDYAVYEQPWQIEKEMNSITPLLLNKWTCAEASRILEMPIQTDYFTGVEVNPLSLCLEKDLLPSVWREAKADTIYLGETAQTHQAVHFPLSDYLLHLAIVGKSGTGKTTLLKQQIALLAEKEIPVLVLEPVKREYRSLLFSGSATRVFTVESPSVPLLINPFFVPKGITLGDYRSSLLSAFKAALSMPDPLPSLFEKAISEAYLHYGWTDKSTSDDYDVRIFDIAEFIRVFRHVILFSTYSSEVKGNMMAGGAFRLQSLIERCKTTFDTCRSTNIMDLLTGQVVLEMGRLEQEQKSLVTALVLISLLAYLKATRESKKTLCNIILLDEAHALLDQGEGTTVEEKALKNTMVQMLANLVTEIRAYGVGVIIADQSPSRIGNVLLDNVETVISFRLDGSEVEMLQKRLGQNRKLLQCLPMLQAGFMLVTNRHVREPLAVKVVFGDSVKQPVVSDAELVARQIHYLTTHAKDYCPYFQCGLAGCHKCSFAVREEAHKCSVQMFNARQKFLSSVEGLSSNIIVVPKALLHQGYQCQNEQYEKLCLCTAVQILRKSALENNIVLGDHATVILLNEVKKEVSQIRMEAQKNE